MQILKTSAFTLAVMAISLLSSSALFAANGLFHAGYGLKAKGMGGVGIGLPQDSVIGAMNPAGYGYIGNRWDIGFEYLKIHGKSEVKGNHLPGGDVKRWARTDIYIPEGGISYQLSCDTSLGLAAFGRGAINSFGGDLGALNGKKKAFAQDVLLYLTPCAAYKPLPCHTFGVGLNCVLGVFKIRGLENLGPSVHPHHVLGKNFDWRPGIGLKVGWIWEILTDLQFGATYETKTVMRKYHKYKGLIANRGNGNLPANFGVGIGWRFCPDWLFGFDVQRYYWSATRLWGNRSTGVHPFGSKHGTGLGWRDQTAYKVGLSWDATDALTLRIGYNHGTQQVPNSQTLANMSIMLVAEKQITCGLTYALGCSGELNLCYIHAFRDTVHGKHSIPPTLGGGEANLTYWEDWAIIGYGYRF